MLRKKKVLKILITFEKISLVSVNDWIKVQRLHNENYNIFTSTKRFDEAWIVIVVYIF